MPTLINERGFRVVMYFNDHDPPHVHVKRAGNEARVQIDPVMIMDNYSYNQNELKLILGIIEKHQTMLMDTWNLYFGDANDV